MTGAAPYHATETQPWLRAWPDLPLILLLLLLPAITFLTNYPGILYTDSVVRWTHAIGGNALPNHPYFAQQLLAGLYAITGEVGIYAIAQSIGFVTGLFLFFRLFLPSIWSAAVAALLFCVPTVNVYSIFHAHDSAAAALGLFSVAFAGAALKWNERAWTLLAGAAVFLLLASSFRSPIFALLLPFAANYAVRGRWLHSALILVATIAALVVALGQNHFSSSWTPFSQSGKSYVWDMLVSLKTDQLETRSCPKIGYLSELATFNAIDLDAILARVDEHSMYSVDVPGEASALALFESAATPSGERRAFSALLTLLRECPSAVIQAKLAKASSLLGWSRPLADAEIFRYDFLEEIKQFNYADSPRSRQFIERYKSHSAIWSVFRQPYLIFLFALTLAVIHWYASGDRTLAIVFGSGLIVYLPYLAISQNHELRYFFPSLLFSFVIIATVATIAGRAALLRLRGWGQRPLDVLQQRGALRIPKLSRTTTIALLASVVAIGSLGALLRSAVGPSFQLDRTVEGYRISITPSEVRVSGDCNKAREARFFVHVYPTQASIRMRAFENRDFDARLAFGGYVQGRETCLFVRDIGAENGAVRVDVGQFRPEQGRLWETTFEISKD